MLKSIILFCTLLIAFNISAENMAVSSSKINWLTNYEDAVNQSKASSKPILLFFTGSDWCSWCHKLEAEVLNTQEFSDAASNKFIFVLLDFPMSSKLSPNTTAQNKQLQKKYDVKGFPSIILIDSKGQKIGSTGYRAGGGKQYAEHLFKMLSDFSGYQQKVSLLEKQNFSGQELKHLYEKAQEFGLDQDANKIVNLGFSSEQKHFFLMERYKFLANEGQNNSPEAINLKKQLLAADANNEHLTHYQIAIIDFETLSTLESTQNKKADYCVAPLADYIAKFGNSDKTNLWRLHMIISQVYYDKKDSKNALAHAKLGLDAAPSLVQPEIDIVIKNIELSSN